MMENCCYDRPEMMVFHMVRKGVFGEIVHAEGGYHHDLRSIKFPATAKVSGVAPGREGEANLYPTHGLGPVAKAWTSTGATIRLSHLGERSSRGLQQWAGEH